MLPDQPVRAIILLQYIEDKEDYVFQSPILAFLEERKGLNTALFSVDNHSDHVSVHYAKTLMDNVPEVVIVCDLKDGESLGTMPGILNHAIRRKGVRLITIGKNHKVDPFIRYFQGVEVRKKEDLSAYLN